MLPKSIDLTDFSASECSDIGLMSELCYVFFKLKAKEPRICPTEKNKSNAMGYL